MKRFLIALFLLTGCSVGAVAETGFVAENGNRTLVQIEAVDRAMLRDDFSDALARCETVKRDWTALVPAIDALLIHDYVDGIGLSIAQMQRYIENGSPDLYFAESEKAKRALASIRDSEYPSWENIL